MLTVMFEVTVEDSSAVMAALAPIMPLVKGFSMESDSGNTVTKYRPLGAAKRQKKVAHPRGSKVESLILDRLGNGPASWLELQETLVKNGWSRNSASPSLSRLRKVGQVKLCPLTEEWSKV